MSDIENESNVISFEAKKAEKLPRINLVNDINTSTFRNKDEAELYFHPSLNLLLDLDKEPDYIIDVDPDQETNFEFIGGEEWPTTPVEERSEWHTLPIQVGETYALSDLDLLKILLGDLLARCEHSKHVIEVELHCLPFLDSAQDKLTISFEVKVNAIYVEDIKEPRCLPEFWYSYSQRMYEYLMEHYEKKLFANEPLGLSIRFNRTGLFWETKNPTKLKLQ